MNASAVVHDVPMQAKAKHCDLDRFGEVDIEDSYGSLKSISSDLMPVASPRAVCMWQALIPVVMLHLLYQQDQQCTDYAYSAMSHVQGCQRVIRPWNYP